MSSSSPIWTTRTGKNIRISEMNDKHLHNAYRLIKRCSRRYARKHWLEILSSEIESRERNKQQELKLSYLIF